MRLGDWQNAIWRLVRCDLETGNVRQATPDLSGLSASIGKAVPKLEEPETGGWLEDGEAEELSFGRSVGRSDTVK